MSAQATTDLAGAVDGTSDDVILAADLEDVYLGNLGTVEADLTLPDRGRRGSRYTWRSGEVLFVSHAGRVTRPSPGVGDRVVPLHLDAVYGAARASRTWDVTVLEEDEHVDVAEALPLHRTVLAGETLDLPAFVVVRLADGRHTVRPVTWDSPTGTHDRVRATGRVTDTDLPAICTVTRVLADPAHADLDRLRVRRQTMVGAQTRLLGDDRLARASAHVTEHLRTVDVDRLLHGFRTAAGLDTRGAQPMTGWDSPDCLLRGHTTGHYLSALSLAAASTGDAKLRAHVMSLVEGLRACQEAFSAAGDDGFVSAYSTEQFDLLEELTTYPTIWAPYYTLDKVMSGLLDAYELVGDAVALDVCARVGAWVGRRLGGLTTEQRDAMWAIYIAGEYGAMVATLVRLARLTGDRAHLTTARWFDNDKLFVPLEQGYDTLDGMHGNQHIPQVIGALDLFTWGGDDHRWPGARRFWELVTAHHAFPVGGVGETEMLRAPDAVAAYLTDKSAETCATYNMLKLSAALFRSAPDARWMDYYELALRNHVAATFSGRADGGSTYFLPLGPGGRRSFDTVENTCCHGTGLENPFRFQDDVATIRDGRTWYVNLWVPAALADAGSGAAFELREVDPGRWTLEATAPSSVQVRLRRPDWAASTSVVRDGVVVDATPAEDGYVVVEGPWCSGDTVEVRLDPQTRVQTAPDDASLFWLRHGPLVLATVDPSTQVLDLSPERARAAVAAAPGSRTWTVDGVVLVPLADVGDEPYHVVFRSTGS